MHVKFPGLRKKYSPMLPCGENAQRGRESVKCEKKKKSGKRKCS
jgi:hypothetical protein